MIKTNNKKIAIIGGGPSCLKAAFDLSPYCDVTIYEKQKSLGQKFLVAGKGGFNLSNAAKHYNLKLKYTPSGFLNKALDDFTSDNTVEWLSSIGIKTFIGSGEKILADKKQKPIEVLNAIKSKLIENDVKIITNAQFVSINSSSITLNIEGIKQEISADYYIFGLGGASWKVTGSDGQWAQAFNNFGIKTLPFQPSNCGVNIKWPKQILENHSGKPLKNIMIIAGAASKYGEATLTDYGLEGNAVYPVIKEIRDSFNKNDSAQIYIDLKPDLSLDSLYDRIYNQLLPKNYSNVINLTRTELALLKAFTTKEEYLNAELFVQRVKKLPIPVNSLRPIDEAISTVGGIDIDELNPDFSLKKQPNIFTIGEMVNWDAPTGGFLLQACFSMGTWAAKSILKKNTVSKF